MDSETHGSVAVVQRSANLDGSAFSALLLSDGLRKAGWEVHVVFGFEGPIMSAFEKRGHHVHVLTHNNWLRTTKAIRFLRNLCIEAMAARRISRFVRDHGIDAVYVNSSVSLAGALAARYRSLPCVWHIRELFSDVGGEIRVPIPFRWLARAIIQWCSTTVIANSRAVVENVLGHEADGVSIVPNAVEERFFDDQRTMDVARRSLGLSQDGLLLGVPGTLRPMKGHPFFFDAVAPLLKVGENVRVVVSGAGEEGYQATLRSQVAKLGIQESVLFLGSVTDMPAFYRACNFVCIPSFAEPFGRTVIEAFAMNTPVIATAVGGIKETIKDGANGLLVPYGDHDRMREAISRLLNDVRLREQLSRRALEDASHSYRETSYQDRLSAIVSQVAAP